MATKEPSKPRRTVTRHVVERRDHSVGNRFVDGLHGEHDACYRTVLDHVDNFVEQEL